MKKVLRFLTLLFLAAIQALSTAPLTRLTVKAVNKLAIERKSQTIELTIKDLAPLGEKDLAKIHVQNAAGEELLCQAVDSDGDYTADLVIFQADFAPRE